MPHHKQTARKALGRGLDALIPKSKTGEIIEIDVSLIDRSKFQPRMKINESALAELVRSVRETGILQPVIVRPLGDRFEIIAGERRLLATKKAGLKQIPAIVREVPDERAIEFALVENIQRENLNPIEEARAYKTLAEKFGLTQAQVAERVGKERATVTNTLRLLSLSENCQKFLEEGKISQGHAKLLLSVEDESFQNNLASRIARENLSVRALEAIIHATLSGDGKTAKRKIRPPEKDANIKSAEAKLQRSLGTKVLIHQKGKQGSVEIFFYSKDDLHHLYETLLRAKKIS